MNDDFTGTTVNDDFRAGSAPPPQFLRHVRSQCVLHNTSMHSALLHPLAAHGCLGSYFKGVAEAVLVRGNES